jgi:hypothetical protein
LKDCRFVAHAVAIIRRRPDRNHALPKPVLKPFLRQLVRSNYDIQLVDVVEIPDNVFPKQKSGPAGTVLPPLNIVVRVRPDQVRKRAAMRDLLVPEN